MRNIKVKEVRLSMKLTQSQLAEKIGITTAAYCRKEKGQRDWKWNEISKICDLAGIDPRTLEV